MTVLRDLNSKELCKQGVNFGFDGNVVFASHGCRGDFQVCTTGLQPLTTTPPPGEYLISPPYYFLN